MTAKEQLLGRAPSFSEEQAQAALEAAEREGARRALEAVGEAFADVDPAELEREAVKAVKQARAELAVERRA